MKYDTINIQGTAYDLTKELNNNPKYMDYELIGFQTYKTRKGFLYTKGIIKCPELKETVMREEKRTPLLHFAEHFSKLNNDEFTTIRDHDKDINVGEIVNIIAPEGRQFKAECTCIETVLFKNISSRLLADDLDIKHDYTNNQPYLDEMRNYYPSLSMDNLVWIYTLQKVKE